MKDYIRINSEWIHKNGGEYIVVDMALSLHKEAIIFYKQIDDNREFCRTKSHFLESFTIKEPFTITETRWFECERNFPALIVDEDNLLIVVTSYNESCLIDDFNRYYSIEDIRLATKDEVDSLFYF